MFEAIQHPELWSGWRVLLVTIGPPVVVFIALMRAQRRVDREGK